MTTQQQDQGTEQGQEPVTDQASQAPQEKQPEQAPAGDQAEQTAPDAGVLGQAGTPETDADPRNPNEAA